jgi:uncharacterized protein
MKPGRGRQENRVQINVSQLLKENIGSVRNYEADTTIDIDGNNNVIRGKVRLMRTDRGILASSSLRTDINISCSRCLSPFDYTLALHIEEEYFPTIDISTGAPLPSPEESGSFTIDENNILDLTEAIRQYALLAVPMKPLCHEECAGLCPVCGVNLNQSSCDCPSTPADPRWAELSKLALSDTETSTDS